MHMRFITVASIGVLALSQAACETVSDLAKNPRCVVRGSNVTNYGGAWPTGTLKAGFVCGGAAAETVPAPPVETKEPEPPVSKGVASKP